VYFDDGEAREIITTTTIQEQTINSPISPEEFALEKLGLKKGDHIYDSRIKLGYTYQETDVTKEPALDVSSEIIIEEIDSDEPITSPIEIVSQEPDSVETTPHNMTKTYFLIGGVILLFGGLWID
jgi:hypothetical protein